jgi:HEAT repeat protein
MRTQTKTFLFVTMGLLVLALVAFTLRQTQPSYQRKSLGQWLDDCGSDRSEAQSTEAREAIRKMGASAVPYLVRELRCHDSRLQLLASDVARRYLLIGSTFCPAAERRKRANVAFPAVAAVARPAIPNLIAALSDKDADVRMRAANCLEHVAYYAGDAEQAIPALICALRDRDMKVRRNAAHVFRHMTTAATGPAVPVLLEIVASGDDLEVRGVATAALGKMRPVSQETVIGLRKALRDDAQPIRSLATQALGDIGAGAKEAVPDLLRLAKEDNDYIRQRAVEALSRIDPDAAVPSRP